MSGFRNKAMAAAEAYAKRRGYEVIGKGYRTRDGRQIDLVAIDGDQLVFIDVRARRNAEKGFPSTTKDAREQATREMAAIQWLQDEGSGCRERSMRFDDISIVVIGADRALVRHLKGVPRCEPYACEQSGADHCEEALYAAA